MKEKERSLLKNSYKANRKRIFVSYSVIAVIMLVVIYIGFFIINNRSIVDSGDGIRQHSMAMAYVGKWLRTIFSNIFIKHTFTIPQFDFSLGFGNDIITTLNYYGLGDITNFLFIFIPVKGTEYGYFFVVMLRIYLCGIGFIAFIQPKINDYGSVLTGAVCYAFCSYILFAVTVHPYFTSGLMYAPWVLLGIDRVFQKKSPVTFILALGLCIMANFYFAYMVCIFMVIYAVVKYIYEYRKNGVKYFFTTVGKFIVFTIMGFCISTPFFIPSVTGLLSSGRVNADTVLPALFNPSYYASLFGAVSDVTMNPDWLVLGFSGVAIMCTLYVFVNIKKYKQLFTYTVIGIIMLLFPVFSHILNGFSYVIVRWSWIFALISASTVSLVINDVINMSAKDKKKLFIASLVYTGCLLLIYQSRTIPAMMSTVLMFITFCLLIGNDILINGKVMKKAVLVLVIISVLSQAYFRFSYIETTYVDGSICRDEVYNQMVGRTPGYFVSTFNDSEFFRYDDYESTETNSAALTDTHSTAAYFSIANPTISELSEEIGLNIQYEQYISNLGNRLILQDLFGVKYVISDKIDSTNKYLKETDEFQVLNNDTSVSKFGNELITYNGSIRNFSSAADHMFVCENDNALPFGYTYDTFMSRDDYNRLDPLEKQNVLLQTAVSDETENINPVAETTNDLTEYDICDKILTTDGVSINGNTVTVKKQEATLSVEVPVCESAEVYVEAFNFSFEPTDTDKEFIETVKSTAGDELDFMSKKRIAYNQIFNPTIIDSVKISAKSSVANSDSFTYIMNNNNFYSGKKNFAVNLGNVNSDLIDDTKKNTIEITFGEPGVYKFDKFAIAYQKLDNTVKDVNERKSEVMKNVEFSDNYVKGTIDVTGNKILATQIVYSDGWHVYVDGTESKLINVNTAFCGVELKNGNHTVEFKYSTPYRTLSIILSAFGGLATVVLAVCYRRKEKTDRQK